MVVIIISDPKSRIVVPEFPQSNSLWILKGITSNDFSIFVFPEIERYYIFLSNPLLTLTSLPLAKFLIVEVFVDNEAIIKAL